jgi:arylsulfatase A-like enzyme
MQRREFLSGIVGAGLAAAAPRRPNIVLIMADDLGYECLGCYGGSSYRTPNLDRLAAAGVRFTHAYSQPLCTPTRTQLLTGKYTTRNWKAFGVLDPKERTIGHMMSAAGYRTCIAGKWQLYSYNPPDYEPEWRGKGMKPEQSGFDEYCLWHIEHTELKGSRYARPTIFANGERLGGLEDAYGEDVFCDYALDFIRRNAARPFFLYYPMALTHDPFQPTPHSAQWKTGNRLETDPKFFKDMVEYMDHTVGRVLSHLNAAKLDAGTLVLFYSDNGTHQSITSLVNGRPIRGGKGLTTDAGTRVPLIASWPGSAKPRVLDDLIDSTDFLPTIAAAAGASTRGFGSLDGVSFLDRIRGGAGNPREWQYCDFNPKPGWDKDRFKPVRYARTQRFKLYEDGRLYDVPADPLEQSPLNPARMMPEAVEAQGKLSAVFKTIRR